MSSSILETQRLLHSDIEKSVKIIVKELQHKAKSQKRKVYQEHRINEELELIKTKSQKLIEMYEDKDHKREKEIEEMTGATLQKTLQSFDEKLNEIKEYHTKFPDTNVVLETVDPKRLLVPTLPVQKEELEKIRFTGEEE